MTKKNITFFELEPWEKKYLKQRLKAYKLIFVDTPLTPATVKHARGATAIGIFIHSHLDKNLLDKFQNIKLITTLSTGYDHIDITIARKKKITVCNVPAYGDNTVAEHTFALLLAITRNIIPSVEKTRRGKFDLEGLRGVDLKDKTIGIIGTGRIGKNVARIAKGFHMNVIAYDTFLDKQAARDIGFAYKPFTTVLQQSDILTLHVPLTKKTTHLINKKNILKLKKGCILINTARGAIIDTEALLLGLQKGIFRGIGLDVLEEECLLKEEKELLTETYKKTCDYKTVLEQHALLKHDNVIITPHNAFNSEEAVKRILDTTIENINSFFKRKPVNVVK